MRYIRLFCFPLNLKYQPCSFFSTPGICQTATYVISLCFGWGWYSDIVISILLSLHGLAEMPDPMITSCDFSWDHRTSDCPGTKNSSKCEILSLKKNPLIHVLCEFKIHLYGIHCILCSLKKKIALTAYRWIWKKRNQPFPADKLIFIALTITEWIKIILLPSFIIMPQY